MLALTEQSFDPAKSLQTFTDRAAGAGAVVSFTGLVRPTAQSGDVSSLHLQAYSPMTENGIREALEEAKSRWSLIAAHVTHRIGSMQPGEPIVFVATASPHRRAAFEAADFLMDYLKTKAVFWKKESGNSGERWIEPRSADYADASRWSEQ